MHTIIVTFHLLLILQIVSSTTVPRFNSRLSPRQLSHGFPGGPNVQCSRTHGVAIPHPLDCDLATHKILAWGHLPDTHNFPVYLEEGNCMVKIELVQSTPGMRPRVIDEPIGLSPLDLDATKLSSAVQDIRDTCFRPIAQTSHSTGKLTALDLWMWNLIPREMHHTLMSSMIRITMSGTLPQVL
jgi:hypothetical protein